MATDKVLVQLGRLNRLRGGVAGVERSEPPQHGVAGVESSASPAQGPFTISSAEQLACLPEGDEVSTPAGTHWQRRQPVNQLCSGADRWLATWPRAQSATSPEKCPRDELSRLLTQFPRRTLFLDLETCGFAGSMVFLIGVIHPHADRLVLSQLLARHYGEEKAILHTFWHLAADSEVLVSFNGKSFDWPMILDRTVLHRLPAVGGLADHRAVHCDLLHHARRRWRRRLPDCKLQTLERWVCGRRRQHDIAGGEIPQAYHDFVRSGDAWLVRSVLHHNALDLVTLLQLARVLVGPAAGPREARSAG